MHPMWVVEKRVELDGGVLDAPPVGGRKESELDGGVLGAPLVGGRVRVSRMEC